MIYVNAYMYMGIYATVYKTYISLIKIQIIISSITRIHMYNIYIYMCVCVLHVVQIHV